MVLYLFSRYIRINFLGETQVSPMTPSSKVCRFLYKKKEGVIVKET
jgi:hypothetical protein